MTETTTRSDRRPYPAYRESGVDWLGDIPDHWEVKQLRNIFRMFNGSTPKSGEADYWDGDIAWVTPDDLGQLVGPVVETTGRKLTQAGYASCGVTLVPAGSLVLSTRAPIGHVAIAGLPICNNQGCKSLALAVEGDSRYFYYTLLAAKQELQARGQGATFTELSSSSLASVRLVEPPLKEQQAIAAYLDREMERIDALVARKERHIGLLREHRQAVVSITITRGLDPGAPTADSGHEWTGRIPAHWSVKPLMHLTPNDRQIMYGIVLPGPHVEGGVPIVKAGSVAPGKLRLSKLRRTDPVIEAGYVRSRLKGGDIVYAIRGSIGAAELVPAELEGANLTQDAARIAPRAGVHGPWLLHAVRSSAFFAQLEAGSLGAAVKGINIRDLKRGLVPVPPPEEQRAIAAHLDAETARIDALAATVRTSIARLREYRAALIAAAVSGRIDVR